MSTHYLCFDQKYEKNIFSFWRYALVVNAKTSYVTFKCYTLRELIHLVDFASFDKGNHFVTSCVLPCTRNPF